MIAGITPTPETKTEGTALNAGASMGKNEFLKLLVAQLEHQDPLAPQEGQEFAAQLAQFSSLEQLTNINGTLEANQAYDLALSNSSMVNLIGKTVDGPGNSFELKEGETILNNGKEIGKILIDNEYPFALIKFSAEKIDTKVQYKSENAIIKINFPDWIK